MRPFRFSLQRVLDVKERLEKQQGFRLAEAYRRVVQEQGRLDALRQARDVAAQAGDEPAVATDPLLRSLNWRERERLYDRSLVQAERLSQAHEGHAQARNALLQTRKERLTLVRLRDNRRREHEKSEERRLQNVVDELFNTRHARTGQEDGDE